MTKRIVEDIKKINKNQKNIENIELNQVKKSIVLDISTRDKSLDTEDSVIDYRRIDSSIIESIKSKITPVYPSSGARKTKENNKIKYDHLLRPIIEKNEDGLIEDEEDDSIDDDIEVNNKEEYTDFDEYLDNGSRLQNKNNYNKKIDSDDVSLDKNKKKSKFPWLISVLSFFILIFVISLFFRKAFISVVPKTINTEINTSILLKKNPESEGIGLKIIELENESVKEVENQTISDVSKKAEGQVTLYNAYSKQNQYLLKDTRLQSTNGKIYKIKGETIIPPLITKNKEIKTNPSQQHQ